MKKTIISISTFVLLLCAIAPVTAQINRTLDTKVADILAQLPTKNLEHSDALMEDILSLNTAGILKFCDMLVPLGTGDDSQARYAINSVAIYSGGKNNPIVANSVEDALLTAIENTSNSEIKTFLIQRLAHCGTNASTTLLSSYLTHDALYNPALATLTSIGSADAISAILTSTKNSNGHKQAAHIEALGNLKHASSVSYLESLALSNALQIRRTSLKALANIASQSSYPILLNAANKASFNADKAESVLALIRYGANVSNTGIALNVAKALLKQCSSPEQLHFRSAALHILSANTQGSISKTLVKEFKNADKNYRGAVIELASKDVSAATLSKWMKAYKKSPAAAKSQIVGMLRNSKEPMVFTNCILPAVKSDDAQLRIAGIKALAFQNKANALPAALQALKMAGTPADFNALQETLLKLSAAEDASKLAANIGAMNDGGKAVLVNVLAARNARSQFDKILPLLEANNETVNAAVYKALSSIATSDHLPQIIALLSTTDNAQDLASIQQAIINVLDQSKDNHSKTIIKAYNSISKKESVLPILPVLNDASALQLVAKSLKSGNSNEQLQAIKALGKWRNNDAIPYLFKSVSASQSSELRSKAFDQYLSQVKGSSFPDAQKLLLIQKLMPHSQGLDEQKKIISSVRGIKTFLSLVFVSNYIDTKGLVTTASNTAIRIALPTPGKKDALSGDIVRNIVSKSIDNLSGPDSQYIKIDVKEFLDNMPNEKGFVSIFNGENLDGWEGLLENPIARAEMSEKKLVKAQEKANAQMLRDWFVKDGVIGFKGQGYNNICTIKDYGDFEMLVDWKITNGGDSGIYLRGTPQVQIWDTALVKVGAQVGSGGLYNNQKNERIPLVVADNPVNEWNTFRIKMVGERVTVHLNGVLVTDNVTLENYWDRKLPIFTRDAIELQAHGEDLGFKNIYVREITSGDVLLSEEERTAGFKSLFNGNDLDHWIGNKKDYLVENNTLVVRPEQGGHGNLYTAEEYSDFNFRFEFKLTPGANNGLGIHAPLEGDAAYVAKELQILDNTASIYANLKPYQYHGSVYGVITAKRGYLNPVGEWNSEEVIIQGDHIKIILNGTVILDGNIKEATKNGTLDKKDHPGLKRSKGHIAFLGHGSELEFRNIRIKDLSH